jgi:DNA-directed RNA polymerase specialized sigma24 family protein
MSKSNRNSAAPVYFTTTGEPSAVHVVMKTPDSFLADPAVAPVIRGALVAHGFAAQDIDDGIQDVYAKMLVAVRKGAVVVDDLRAMKALCAKVATNHALDVLRKEGKRKRDFLGPCNADEYTPLEYGAAQRDPVDAGRQLEILAQLFREGRMPEDGVDILEGVASKCTYKEIAEELGITELAVRGRVGTMRQAFRARMASLGLLPWMQPLRVIVSEPSAIASLRQAA